MTDQNDYYTRTADLIESAFTSLADGLALDPGGRREDHLAEAQAKLQAAQAIATLAAARESRLLALATLAAADNVGGEAPAPVIAQEAYLAAAVGLGLVLDHGDQGVMSMEDLRAALADGNDPADADLGDLP